MYFDANRIGHWLFVLALVMIVLVYFVGARALIQAIAPAFVQIDYAVTGRNARGNFANYPK